MNLWPSGRWEGADGWSFREFTCTFHSLKCENPSPGVCWSILVPTASGTGPLCGCQIALLRNQAVACLVPLVSEQKEASQEHRAERRSCTGVRLESVLTLPLTSCTFGWWVPFVTLFPPLKMETVALIFLGCFKDYTS